MPKPVISLIVCTIGRPQEFEALLHSFSSQSFKEFEVLVIDQSRTTATATISGRFSHCLDIKHRSVDFIGLSRGRNVGLDMAQGWVVGFSDDDCRYPNKDLLERVLERLERGRLDFLSGRLVERSPAGLLPHPYFPTNEQPITKENLLKTVVSAALFVRKTTVRFDEELGAGSLYGSGEESDYVIRLMQDARQGGYFPDIMVEHERKTHSLRFRRSYHFGQGMGAMFAKNRATFSWPMITQYLLARPCGGALYSLLRLCPGRSCEYMATMAGRITGFTQALSKS